MVRVRLGSITPFTVSLWSQMSKVASSLLSGKYSSPTPPDPDTPPLRSKTDKTERDDDLVVVAPRMFKHLVGHGHSEFSSGRQQDAAEYMQHLLEVSVNAASF